MNPSFGPRKAKPSERQREAVNPIPATNTQAVDSKTGISGFLLPENPSPKSTRGSARKEKWAQIRKPFSIDL
jgi:hypothetical protein